MRSKIRNLLMVMVAMMTGIIAKAADKTSLPASMAVPEGTDVYELAISLSNEAAYTGGQFDLTLPEGMTLVPYNDGGTNYYFKKSDRIASHNIISNTLNGSTNQFRCMFYSLSWPQTAISGNDGVIATCQVSTTGKAAGAYNITLSNQEFDGNGANVRPANVTGTLYVTKLNVTAASTLTVGNETAINVSMLPAGAPFDPSLVSLSVAPTDVAEITAEGKLLGLAPGTATVTATYDGTQTATCDVTVTPMTPDAEGNYVINYLKYRIKGGDEVSIRRYGWDITETGSRHVVIPSHVTINGTVYRVTEIDDYAFYNCTTMITIEIATTVTKIGKYAFAGCTGLTEVTIPDSVTEIGIYAFQDCTSIVTVHMSRHITILSEGIFYGCIKLVNITLYEGITHINLYAFYGCSSLVTINIPASVIYIHYWAFRYCIKITTYVVHADNTVYCSIGGVIYSKDTTILYLYPAGLTTTEYTVPSHVTTIGEYAFCDCVYLIRIYLHNHIIIINKGAFYGCTGLTEIEIPESVTTIPEEAFYGCTALVKVTIYNTMVTILKWAFYDCRNLTNIYVYCTTPPTLDEDVFYNVNYSKCILWVLNGYVTVYKSVNQWKNFTIYTIDTAVDGKYYKDGVYYRIEGGKAIVTYGGTDYNNADYTGTVTIPSSIRINGVLYDVTGIDEYAFYGCTGLTNIVIPGSVTWIGKYAFAGCTGLLKVVIPDSVTVIGEYAFYNCTSLIQVYISKHITIIPEGLFYGCSSLTEINIPEGVTTINKLAFVYCTSLLRVYIPSTVVFIEYDVFNYCLSLIQIIVAEGNTYYCSIGGILYNYDKTILIRYPAGLTATEYTIPGFVTSIAKYAFHSCVHLIIVHIHNYITIINEYAFYGCNKMTTLYIGKLVANIGAGAYSGCTSLSKIVVYRAVPPTLGDDVFEGVDKGTCLLLVPDGSVSGYKGADQWKDFLNIDVITEDDETPDPETYGNLTFVYEPLTPSTPANTVAQTTTGEWAANELILIDQEYFYTPYDFSVNKVTYKRTFNNTNWQAMYVPYNMGSGEWSPYGQIWEVNNVHEYDDNSDGVLDRGFVEYRVMSASQLHQNTPYIIKPSATGYVEFVGYNKQVKATPTDGGMIQMSSTSATFTIRGTYEDKTDMFSSNSYALSQGDFYRAESDAVILKPFRLYLNLSKTQYGYDNDANIQWAPARVRIVTSEEMSAINAITCDADSTDSYYDMLGRKVNNPTSGVYIHNGQKVYIK